MSRVITDYATASTEAGTLRVQRLAMTERKDGAYLERNRCVALIARMALASGWRAGIARTAIEGWSEDWHGCVYIHLPTGQESWHYHDSQAYLFADLPAYTFAWDGHDTPEKYRRVDEAFANGKPAPVVAVPQAERAVQYLVRRVQADPRLAYLIGPGSQSWDLLTDALASAQHRRVDEVQAELERGLKVQPVPPLEG